MYIRDWGHNSIKKNVSWFETDSQMNPVCHRLFSGGHFSEGEGDFWNHCSFVTELKVNSVEDDVRVRRLSDLEQANSEWQQLLDISQSSCHLSLILLSSPPLILRRSSSSAPCISAWFHYKECGLLIVNYLDPAWGLVYSKRDVNHPRALKTTCDTARRYFYIQGLSLVWLLFPLTSTVVPVPSKACHTLGGFEKTFEKTGVSHPHTSKDDVSWVTQIVTTLTDFKKTGNLARGPF